ncbi:glucan 1,4-alpha-glucosidase [Streptomyces sp. NPDC048639]|uniref:glucan 1,4-alpha-glucosidase n=1 Tax=Streptomyces sp. NPDC048639 TaxID=3365581 RepID=UPI0037200AB0
MAPAEQDLTGRRVPPVRRTARIAAMVALGITAGLLPVSPVAGASTATATAREGDGDAPGGPGADATWTTGDKEGVGTALSERSKVWYTLTGGGMSEVYYPSADTPNVRQMQFAVTDGNSFTQREDQHTEHTVRLVDSDSLTYRQTTTDKAGRWRLTKTYVTDPDRSSVLVNVRFKALKGGPYQLYVLFDPSLAGDSGNDIGRSSGDALVTTDSHKDGAPVAGALAVSTGFSGTTTGYVGSSSDGWTDLDRHHKLTATHSRAGAGNINQVGRIPVAAGGTTDVTLALGFGGNGKDALSTARASLARPFDTTARRYRSGWQQYLAGLRAVPRQLRGTDMEKQYRASVMTVRAHEDKTYPGAFSASLTIPWGQSVKADGGGGGGGGYHFVWARDEYQQVTGLLAAGDTAAARRAVKWLFTRQQLPDGHFPQTSHTDGTPDQTNIQLDETAFPILLAWQVGRHDRAFYRDHVRKAADYLVAHGPSTPQERWEETGGYSPSTLADMIAALTAAADIARRNGDGAGAAVYQATADSWQRQVEKWTYTTNGPIGDGKYYLRISGSGDPNDGAVRNWANGAGPHPENALTDAGFLELVRLGVKSPHDPYVAHSLAAVDASLKVRTPSGELWRRYTYDGYGETADGAPWTGKGVGRPWPLLSGERGEYELARGGDAMTHLRTMAATANDGYMIPEQVWDRPEPTDHGHVFGKGTGSAAPLAWAMSQYVRLAQGIRAGAPVETPRVVARRYATGQTPAAPELTVTSPANLSTVDSRTVRVTGTTSARRVYVSADGRKKEVPVHDGKFDARLHLQGISTKVTIAAVGRDGGTAEAVRTVMSLGKHLGGLKDPAGDDHGPGSYTLPTDTAFVPGVFDLRAFDVYRDGELVRLVARIDGQITNPWGGDGISLQRLNVYVRDPQAEKTTSHALPGTNADTDGAWQLAVVGEGRHHTSRFGLGAYGPGLKRSAKVELGVIPAGHRIVLTLPATAFGALDPAKAEYQVSMLGESDDGEGIGNVRPVYSLDHWNNGPSWVKQFRFGGGAGETDSSQESQDTDTSDPNTIDIITGPGQAQKEILDWKANAPVQLPFAGVTVDQARLNGGGASRERR